MLKDLKIGGKPDVDKTYIINLTDYPYADAVTFPRQSQVASMKDFQAIANNPVEAREWMRYLLQLLHNSTTIAHS